MMDIVGVTLYVHMALYKFSYAFRIFPWEKNKCMYVKELWAWEDSVVRAAAGKHPGQETISSRCSVTSENYGGCGVGVCVCVCVRVILKLFLSQSGFHLFPLRPDSELYKMLVLICMYWSQVTVIWLEQPPVLVVFNFSIFTSFIILLWIKKMCCILACENPLCCFVFVLFSNFDFDIDAKNEISWFYVVESELRNPAWVSFFYLLFYCAGRVYIKITTCSKPFH